MKKTVSVNIKGTNFLIEEDAYELLQDYLDRLSIALQNDEGSKEIIEDVELRIAEICSTKLSDVKTVIELKDIEDILVALGDPVEFISEDDEPVSNAAPNNDDSGRSERNNDRRLFRDADSATIGGVCAGIANYFGIDVVIIRAVFVVLFLFAGFGFPLYIILWIIIPKAESTIDKLRMKGRPITVEAVKKEVEDAAERIKSESQSFSSKLRNDGSYKKRVSRGKRIITSILGFGFIGFGIINLIGFLIFIIAGFEFLPISGENGFMSITELGELVLSNPGDVQQAWIGGMMAWISSILFWFLLGSILLFRIRNKWSKISLGGLFLTGIIGVFMCATVAVKTSRDFARGGDIEMKIGSTAKKELVIIPRLANYKTKDGFQVSHKDHFLDIEITKDLIKQYGIEVQYIPSNDSTFTVRQSLKARASSQNTAREKSGHINHFMEMRNDTLYVDVEYSYPRKDKIRDQEVTLIIEIPEGGAVRLGNRIIHLGDEGFDNGVDHPYYKKQGMIRGDGSYDHYYDRHYRRTHRHNRHYNNELEEEIIEEVFDELEDEGIHID